MRTFSVAALAALVALHSVQAQAALFAFSYGAGAGTIAGRVEGTVQADGNTIAIDRLLDFVTFNGVGALSLPWLGTADMIYGGNRAPTVTFDGSFVDFAACEFEYCSPGEGVIFDPDTIALTQPVVRTSPAFGDIAPVDFDAPEPEIFDPRKWTLTATTTAAVPEPATWAMLIIGFGLVADAIRRRSIRVSFA